MTTTPDAPLDVSHYGVEPNLIGPYKVRLRAYLYNDLTVALSSSITVEEAENMVVILQQAIRSVRRRQITDAVCGDCQQCDNTRMVTVQRHGQPWGEHCPECTPKIDAAKARGLL